VDGIELRVVQTTYDGLVREVWMVLDAQVHIVCPVFSDPPSFDGWQKRYQEG
jgi:hypothetical protein